MFIVQFRNSTVQYLLETAKWFGVIGNILVFSWANLAAVFRILINEKRNRTIFFHSVISEAFKMLK
jgi:hypothetical protein